MSELTRRREGPAELRSPVSNDPADVAHARRAVRDVVRRWGLDLDPDVVALLVSELVTNALVHGRPPMEVRASRVGSGLRVEVLDGAGERQPRRRSVRPSADDPRGRGLTIVSALATRWGTAASPGGKAVWLELDP
ncbi:MAG TPA: ATP-binding protein [Jiangellales bacterium]|nr:ATP-binding protein [Jiangellales bacterium]